MSSLIKEVRQDPQYETFARILEQTKKRVNIEGSVEEALSLHASRTSRALNGNDRYSPKKLIDASFKDLSVRSRLVEIRVKNDKQMSHLREAMKALRRYISTEYADDLREFSNAEQRNAFIDRVMKAANTFLAEGDACQDTIDHLVKDLDQAGHNMRHAIDCLKILQNKNGSHVV
jgi:hypothetical protein